MTTDPPFRWIAVVLRWGLTVLLSSWQSGLHGFFSNPLFPCRLGRQFPLATCQPSFFKQTPMQFCNLQYYSFWPLHQSQF